MSVKGDLVTFPFSAQPAVYIALHRWAIHAIVQHGRQEIPNVLNRLGFCGQVSRLFCDSYLTQFSTFKFLTRLNSFSLLLIKTKFLGANRRGSAASTLLNPLIWQDPTGYCSNRELWNNGSWENGSLIYRQKSLLTRKSINGKLPCNINIPIFHHSIVPDAGQESKP